MFNNSCLDWAKIYIGKTVIEGPCTYWEMGSNGAYIKLVVNGKGYLTATTNVLLMQNPNQK